MGKLKRVKQTAIKDTTFPFAYVMPQDEWAVRCEAAAQVHLVALKALGQYTHRLSNDEIKYLVPHLYTSMVQEAQKANLQLTNDETLFCAVFEDAYTKLYGEILERYEQAPKGTVEHDWEIVSKLSDEEAYTSFLAQYREVMLQSSRQENTSEINQRQPDVQV